MRASELHIQADHRLQNAENPKKIALIHTALALGASFLLLILSAIVSELIADTGGLDGMGTRAILSTIHDVLNLAVTIALPFWQMGIFFAALRWARGGSATLSDLLRGFRRWSSVLGCLLLQALLYTALAIFVAYVGSTIFMMTPLAAPLTEIFEPLMDPAITQEQMLELMTPELMESALRASVPLLIISGVLFAGIAIVIYYRIRFSSFALMEGQTAGKALLRSFAVTKSNCRNLVKLDLSFWWFYLLQVLLVAVSNGDLLLQLAGITLPMPDMAASLLFYALGAAGQLLLLWQFEAKRVTVYGIAYCTFAAPLDQENAIVEV